MVCHRSQKLHASCDFTQKKHRCECCIKNLANQGRIFSSTPLVDCFPVRVSGIFHFKSPKTVRADLAVLIREGGNYSEDNKPSGETVAEFVYFSIIIIFSFLSLS